MVIGVIVSLLLVVFGIAIKYFKWYWLIAGYNTMSKEKKQNVNIEELCKFIGNSLFFLAGILLAAFIFNYFGNGIAFIIMLGIFLLFILFIIIRAQKYDLNKKENNKSIILIIVLIILISAISLGSVIFGSLSNTIDIDSEYIKIGGTYGIELPVRDIESVYLKDNIPDIKSKVNGYDAGSIRKGTFNLESIGKGRLFIETNDGPFIYIITTEGYIIINFKEKDKTEQYYNEIIEIINRG